MSKLEWMRPGVARIVIDGGTPLNIIDSSASAELAGIVRKVSADPSVRAVVIAGHGGKAFIGGADVKEMRNMDAARARSFITGLGDLLEAVRQIPVPVIAAIDGWCLGAGFELAALCDFRISTSASRFGMPEVVLGMPSVLHASVLSSHIGEGRTRWLLLTGQIADAADMQDWGFLQDVVGTSELDRIVDEALDQILACGEGGVRLQKELLTYWEERRIDLALDYSTAVFGRAFETDEPARFIDGFLSKAKRREGART